MKKLYILCALALASNYANCQPYHPLPDSNAKWCIMYNNHIIPPPPWWYTNYWETYYTGDTIILGRDYKKLQKTEYDIYCLSSILNGPEYLGALRDDPIDKKVFFIPQGQTTEELLYDFTLGIGDTLFSYLNWYQPLVVEDVDSIFITGDYHKTIIFEFGAAEIIEGIGSTTGITEELIAFEGGSNLCTLYVDSAQIYPEYEFCNLKYTDTCLSIGVNEIDDSLKQIAIFPNPAYEYCYIIIPENLLTRHLRVKIVSTYGNLSGDIELTELTNKIGLDGLNKGIYVVNLYIDNRLALSKKIAKM